MRKTSLFIAIAAAIVTAMPVSASLIKLTYQGNPLIWRPSPWQPFPQPEDQGGFSGYEGLEIEPFSLTIVLDRSKLPTPLAGADLEWSVNLTDSTVDPPLSYSRDGRALGEAVRLKANAATADVTAYFHNALVEWLPGSDVPSHLNYLPQANGSYRLTFDDNLNVIDWQFHILEGPPDFCLTPAYDVNKPGVFEDCGDPFPSRPDKWLELYAAPGGTWTTELIGDAMTPVPLPASLALSGSALALLGGLSAVRRRRAAV